MTIGQMMKAKTNSVNLGSLPPMEARMLNILRVNPIPVEDVKGTYAAAVHRLIKKGIAVKSPSGYKLSIAAFSTLNQ